MLASVLVAHREDYEAGAAADEVACGFEAEAETGVGAWYDYCLACGIVRRVRRLVEPVRV